MKGPARSAALAACVAAALAASPAPAPAGDDADAVVREMTARTIRWDDVGDVFDPAWILPDDRRDPDADEPPADLVRGAVVLAAPAAKPAGPAPVGAPAAPPPMSFSDAYARCRSFGDDVKARDAWLEALRAARPADWAAWGDALLQLGRSEFFDSPKWDPAKDHDRDGILTGRPFRASAAGAEPWTKIDVATPVQQAAAVFHCDVDAIKAGENDYTLYPRDVGAEYLFIHAAKDSFVKGKDARGRPFSALRVLSRSDLPFPYSTYDCDLRILNRVGDDGLVRCDVYSRSPDFHWLAGQDTYVPLTTSEGAFAGMLVVRVYGFDLDDVPDGEGDVREALRASLGNLKRRSEAAFAASGGKVRTLRGSVPDFVVRGVE